MLSFIIDKVKMSDSLIIEIYYFLIAISSINLKLLSKFCSGKNVKLNIKRMYLLPSTQNVVK